LPHRPLFRPSPPAIRLLDAWDRCAGWREFGRYHSASARGRQADWQLLSDTRALEAWKRNAELTGFYDRLRPGADFVLLGLVIEGGQGLVTADDRRFLGALAGTDEASDALANQERYAALVRQHSEPRAVLEGELSAGVGLEAALLSVVDRYRPEQLGWPRSGLIRVVDPARVLHRRLTADEVGHGLAGDRTWVPFEKGDSSGEDGGAAKWTRSNPIAIDWTTEAVALLRRRARQADSYRKPRLQNEHLWGQGGVTWNRIARYFRVRRVEEGGIFGDKAPVIRSTAEWLPNHALLALLNSPLLDFVIRTFLGSLMQIEIGHLRRVPVPVLTGAQVHELDELGRRAVAAKAGRDGGQSADIAAVEREIDEFVRDLYGIPRDADLWVVR
jgi:hypothetical protein